MKKFLGKIEQICENNNKVAMFIDMDGTITVYEVYPEGNVKEKMEEEYQKAEPIKYIIEILKEINKELIKSAEKYDYSKLPKVNP